MDKQNMKPYPGERMVCFICDYGLICLGVLVVLAVAAWRIFGVHEAAPPPLPATPPTPVATLMPDPTRTAVPGDPTTVPGTEEVPPEITPTITPTPVPLSNPEFIIAFIPVRWRSGQASLERAAQEHAAVFIQESQIDDYFTVRIEVLTDGPEGVSLTDWELDYYVLEYGLEHFPADRYIGITDGDLAPEGQSSVAGWTTGLSGQSVVAERDGASISAHELGHTFGLCDEYSYPYWSEQNLELVNGCPNPYPPDCPTTSDDMVMCDGNPTSDGRNSIMGPSGMDGGYGFNSPCLDHLHQVFQTMAAQR